MEKPNPTVHFLRNWRGRQPGQTTSDLGGGVAIELAKRGIVELLDGPGSTDAYGTGRASRSKRSKR